MAKENLYMLEQRKNVNFKNNLNPIADEHGGQFGPQNGNYHGQSPPTYSQCSFNLRGTIFKEIEYLLVDKYYPCQRQGANNEGNVQQQTSPTPGNHAPIRKSWPNKKSSAARLNIIQNVFDR